MNLKRVMAVLLSGSMAFGLAACGSTAESASKESAKTDISVVEAKEAAQAAQSGQEQAAETADAPKYVFLFIGDGMSYPQFQATADYLGAIADEDYEQAEPSLDYEERDGAVLDGPVALNFMDFEVAGSAVTYDSCSFAPDSASTATSIATGNKTYSGMINVAVDGSTEFETIAEKLHEQKV